MIRGISKNFHVWCATGRRCFEVAPTSLADSGNHLETAYRMFKQWLDFLESTSPQLKVFVAFLSLSYFTLQGL
jgi:hypothetical protein